MEIQLFISLILTFIGLFSVLSVCMEKDKDLYYEKERNKELRRQADYWKESSDKFRDTLHALITNKKEQR
jgi:hypothetical protein